MPIESKKTVRVVSEIPKSFLVKMDKIKQETKKTRAQQVRDALELMFKEREAS